MFLSKPPTAATNFRKRICTVNTIYMFLSKPPTAATNFRKRICTVNTTEAFSGRLVNLCSHSLDTYSSSSSSSSVNFKSKSLHSLPLNSPCEPQMTVTAAPCIKDGCLFVNGKVVSTKVPPNVFVSPAAGGSTGFLGATSSIPSCRHNFSLGVLEELKFLSLFRFKLWWMIPRFGKLGSEIPMETQFLLLEAKEESAISYENTSESTTENTLYILLLPVLDGLFRSSLLGTPSNELEFCIESGDAYVQTSETKEAVFINSGNNPFELIKSSMKILERHMGTFTHIEHKKVPAHLDWFGWCTWDAFHKDVNPQGIIEGIESFLEGDCPIKFLIIDDGWQETVNEFHIDGESLIKGTFVEESEFARRLVDIKENGKFRGTRPDGSSFNLQELVASIKEKYGLKFVYMWHALVGYWGGVLPSSEPMKKYNPKMTYPKQSPGNVGNLRDIAMDSLEKYGVGLIHPEKIYDFYNDLHGYLASCDADGVKVDVQSVLETLGSGYGGRVSLTRKYQYSLEQSIVKNFKDNSIICCMSHNTDSIYSSKKNAVVRASEDFMPREPTFQTVHVASVTFNSLLLGEIMVPDWDMFHSKHDTGEFHAAARALGGGAVYVSDKPGTHDFKILKKLVLPDGSTLRARRAGRPTRDCLFADPVMDGKTLLKIWNLNNCTGVLGVFNCQGAGNWPLKQKVEDTPDSERTPLSISGRVSPLDVEFLGEVAGGNWNGECILYAFHSGSLSRLPKRGNVDLTLVTLQCEIFTIAPVRVFNEGLHVAPLGLLDMYNSGGAIEAVSCTLEPPGCKVKIRARGSGRFGVFSDTKPRHCLVDMKEEEFTYDSGDGLLTIKLENGCNLRDIEMVY